MKRIFSARSGPRVASWICALVLLSCAAAASQAAPPQGQPRGLVSPVRIAAMPGERLLVSDFRTGEIHVVRARSLSVEHSFAIDGSPVAVAWSQGRIYVGNETKGCVEAYNLGGELLATFGEPGSIRLPNAIVVHALTGRLLVLDAFEKVIKVFSLDGAFLYPMTAPGALVNPSAMGFDPDRQLVLVSDFGAFSDNLFRKPQPFVRQLDLAGNERLRFTGTFARPQGLAVDGQGHLYVVDSFNGEVQVLDAATGVALEKLGGFGNGPANLSLPLDVVYSPEDGNLYVTDNGHGRIVVFARRSAP